MFIVGQISIYLWTFSKKWSNQLEVHSFMRSFLFLFSGPETKTSWSGLMKWKYAEPLGFTVVSLTISTFPCVRHSAFAYLTEQRVKYCLLPAIKMDGTLFFFCGKTCVLVCEVSWWPTYQTISLNKDSSLCL